MPLKRADDEFRAQALTDTSAGSRTVETPAPVGDGEQTPMQMYSPKPPFTRPRFQAEIRETMKANSAANIVERMVIPHTAFAEARQRIQQSFAFSAAKAEAEGLAIVGESGTGKTSVLKSFQSNHMPTRGREGMEIPILYASVPPMPTVKSLAGVMLAALSAPDCERGTENGKSRRLRI